MRIQETEVEVESRWGVTTRNTLLSHAETASAVAVFFPGASMGCDTPLLYYARKAALLAGCDTLSLEYGFQVVRAQEPPSDLQPLVAEALTAINRVIQPAHKRLLFVSKSLGTLVAGEVAQHLTAFPIRHLFLTPVGFSIPYLQQAQGAVITGTADQQFPEEYRRQIRTRAALNVIEVPGAGHGLELPDVSASLAILRLVCDTCTGLARATG